MSDESPAPSPSADGLDFSLDESVRRLVAKLIMALVVVMTVAACEMASMSTGAYCRTDEERARVAEIFAECSSSARWSNHVRQCRHQAEFAVCPEVRGHRYSDGRFTPCELATDEQQVKACRGLEPSR